MKRILNLILSLGSLSFAHAQIDHLDHVNIQTTSPSVTFTETGAPARIWKLEGGNINFSLNHNMQELFVFEVDTPANSLYVKDDGNIGFGTSTPGDKLHVVSGNSPGLRLEQDASGAFTPQTWRVAGNENDFFISDSTKGTFPFSVEPCAPDFSFRIIDDGKIGCGTKTPGAGLHLFRDDGKSGLLVQEQSGTPKTRVMAKLQNNGSPRLEFEDTNEGSRWLLNPNAAGDFNINRIGSGTDFIIRKSGDGQFRGEVTATGFNNVSSRSKKENFETIDKSETLEKLSQLPVEKWNYKLAPDERHIGPMAEDFNQQFPGSKSKQHINLSDLSGVMLASIQQLKIQNEELKRTNQTLEQRLSDLENRLLQLE